MGRRAFPLLGFFAWAAIAALGQDKFNEAPRLNNDGAALYARGELDAAEHLYRAALVDSVGDDLTTANIASNLGALYKRENRYSDAERMYRRALELRRRRAPARPEVADTMGNLAEIYRLEGRYEEARDLTAAAVGALEQADASSPNMPLFLSNWAIGEQDLHHFGKAEELLRRAWTMAEKTGGPESRLVAIISNNLGQVLADKQDFAEAEALYRRAGAIFEQVGADGAHDFAITLSNLGRLMSRMGRGAEARAAELRALAILNGQPRSDDRLRAAIWHNLGNIETADGHFAEALGYFQRSLVARERILGREHPLVADLLFDYAEAARRAGQRSQARKLRKRAERVQAQQRVYTVDASAFVHPRQ
jgi:tetratricopeptide (TPR) repeat protein